MKELELNEKNLVYLLKNLRKEDKEEIDLFFERHTLRDFTDICFKNKRTLILLGDNNNLPLAAGGVVKVQNNGMVWLLCHKNSINHKKELYKFIKNKIKEYENEYEILYNQIYKSNFKALKWLCRLGFKVKNADDKNFKIFYKITHKKAGK